MMLWLIIGTIAALALVALAWPLFAAPTERYSPDETDYLVEQIDDVERERAIGVLSDAEAQAARLEAKRRLLASDRTRKETAANGNISATLRQAAVMAVGAIPLAAIALYLAIGSADQASRTPSAPANDPAARPVADLVAALEGKLAANPEDLDGWVTLAESYGSFGRFADAAKAFEKAAALDPSSAFLEAALAESLILANAGSITEAADAALARALTLDPKEPRARYYSARSEYQNGDRDEALRMMAALVNDAPNDASWLPLAQNELVSMAMAMGRTLDEAGILPEAQARLRRTMEQDVAAKETPAPAGDVAVLEQKVTAGDAHYTEWLKLAELYAGAGDAEKASEIIARARERYAAAPFVLQEIARAEERVKGLNNGATPRRGPTAEQIEAAQSMTPEDQQAMIQGMVSGLAARLEAEPNDPDGWMMLGRSYGVLGDLGKSADAFSRAAELKPNDIAVQLSYAQALLAIAEASNAPINSNTEKILEGVLERDPDQTFALYYLGLAAQQREDKSTARRHWERLASLLPAGSDDAKRISELLRSLD